MGIFGLGRKKTAFVFSDLPNDSFTKLLGMHLQRVQTLGEQQRSFIDKYLPNDVISLLAASARDKMALTQRDGQEHSAAMSKAPISYWICTVPYSMQGARDWFVRRYGGYTRLLGDALVSAHYKAARCKVLVHIVYGKNETGEWVHMTVLPENGRKFGLDPILPIELMTEDEKRVSGLA